MKRVLVLGYFGYHTNQLDGQTVKTRDLYRLVCEQNENPVDYYDTEEFKYNKASIFRMYWKIICCSTLIYLPAHNNLKTIFPTIFFFSLIFRFKIHYFVVGGWLREFLGGKPIHRYMLSRIRGIHAETQRLKKELEEYYYFKNVDVFPNFRFFNFVPTKNESSKLRLVFMARIQKMKGLDWIFSLANYIKNNKLDSKFSLDFYGQVQEDEKTYFFNELEKFPFAQYHGALQPNKIHTTLSMYDVLLLPTHYYTEGLPGSIVDAYISGIPVIVTKWKHAHEFIEDGVSGYIIPFQDGENELINKVLILESDRSNLNKLKECVLVKRKEFGPPSLTDILM